MEGGVKPHLGGGVDYTGILASPVCRVNEMESSEESPLMFLAKLKRLDLITRRLGPDQLGSAAISSGTRLWSDFLNQTLNC